MPSDNRRTTTDFQLATMHGYEGVIIEPGEPVFVVRTFVSGTGFDHGCTSEPELIEATDG